MSNAHRFALYSSWLPTSATDIITDKELVHRLVHVLRAQQGQEIILFNQEYHLLCTITSLSNKSVAIAITKREKNKQLTPSVTVLLPILKRAAFEDALYMVTELGANKIQLISTEKTTKWHAHDIERAQRIVIAAAEQSKQFAFPHVVPPIGLKEAIKECEKPLVIADIQGKPLRNYLPFLEKQIAITLLVGPEGDFSQSEYVLLNSMNQDSIYRCTLTPTILKSEHAIALLVGMVRSLL